MVLPEEAGGFLRVGGDGRRQVEDAGEAPLWVVAGPARVAGRGEPRPGRPELGGDLLGGRERGRADQPGGEALVQVPEDERPVKAVAGAEQAAVGGRGPGQLVQVGRALAGRLRLRQVQRRHAEHPVAADQLVQALGGRAGEGRAVGLLAVRARAERPQGLRRPFVADRAELPAHGQEDPVLVAGVTDDQRHGAGVACRQRLPRGHREHLPVHDRRERGRRVRDPPPPVLVLAELAVHRVPGRHQPDRVHAGQVVGRRAQAELGRDGAGDVRRQRRRVVDAGHALRDRPPEQARRQRAGQQRGDRPGPGRLAEDGDLVRVTAEGGDVVADPLQRGHLVEQAAVGGRPLELGEPLDACAVVEGDHHQIALAREAAAVVAGGVGRSHLVGATVDPHHDRPAGGRVGRRRPDVEGQPVVVGRLRSGPVGA